MASTNFLTVAEVAHTLRLTPYAVTRMCRDGHLRATKPGKSWLIPEDALSDLIAKGYRQQKAAS